jgi:hypothetical protein
MEQLPEHLRRLFTPTIDEESAGEDEKRAESGSAGTGTSSADKSKKGGNPAPDEVSDSGPTLEWDLRRRRKLDPSSLASKKTRINMPPPQGSGASPFDDRAKIATLAMSGEVFRNLQRGTSQTESPSLGEVLSSFGTDVRFYDKDERSDTVPPVELPVPVSKLPPNEGLRKVFELVLKGISEPNPVSQLGNLYGQAALTHLAHSDGYRKNPGSVLNAVMAHAGHGAGSTVDQRVFTSTLLGLTGEEIQKAENLSAEETRAAWRRSFDNFLKEKPIKLRSEGSVHTAIDTEWFKKNPTLPLNHLPRYKMIVLGPLSISSSLLLSMAGAYRDENDEAGVTRVLNGLSPEMELYRTMVKKEESTLKPKEPESVIPFSRFTREPPAWVHDQEEYQLRIREMLTHILQGVNKDPSTPAQNLSEGEQWLRQKAISPEYERNPEEFVDALMHVAFDKRAGNWLSRTVFLRGILGMGRLEMRTGPTRLADGDDIAKAWNSALGSVDAFLAGSAKKVPPVASSEPASTTLSQEMRAPTFRTASIVDNRLLLTAEARKALDAIERAVTLASLKEIAGERVFSKALEQVKRERPRDAEIAKYHLQNWSSNEIAEELNMGYQHVTQRLVETQSYIASLLRAYFTGEWKPK